jgi:hypothetical protein
VTACIALASTGGVEGSERVIAKTAQANAQLRMLIFNKFTPAVFYCFPIQHVKRRHEKDALAFSFR